ncbi:MAG: hypothetical protein IZT60_03930 [Gammaproteobacteria bacterium]|nr:hypothetical protein [Gammaproteobacteria bacterium]
MMPQSTFMIAASVRSGELENLRQLLATMNRGIGEADPDNTLVPFGRFDRLHVARFVIIEANTASDITAYGLTPYPWQPSLAFLGDCDGDSGSFLTQLVDRAGPGLIKIFSLCEDFAEKQSSLLAWMKAHQLQPAANYVNWIGRTVIQVHEEAALHRTLTLYLQKIADDTGRENSRALRQQLLSHVEMESMGDTDLFSRSDRHRKFVGCRNLSLYAAAAIFSCRDCAH